MNTLKPVTTLFLACCLMPYAAAQEGWMRLRLKDGSFATGHVTDSPHAGRLGWAMEDFDAPFYIDTAALRSISLLVESDDELPSAEQAEFGEKQILELQEGGLLVGKLLSMDEQLVVVQSELLGQIKIARNRLLTIADAGYAGQIVYQGPIDEKHWQAASDSTDWTFEAGTLVTEKPVRWLSVP